MLKRILSISLLLLPIMSLVGCQGKPKHTLSVIAGSELKDIEPMLDKIAKETGVTLDMKYIGTLDGADMIANKVENHDLGWFSHAKYLSLLQGEEKIIRSEEKIGLSPVVPAVKRSLAQKWGWIDNPNLSWVDIAEKARAGEFKFAMTDPTASNSGFSTVMAVQAAFSNSGEVVTADDVDHEKLKDFYSGQVLTSGSSGWLAEAFVKDQDSIDGLFNYESVLMNLNQSGELKEPLEIIYPREGIVTADYPLILLNDDKREAYNTLVDYLKTPDFQSWMMENTNRRPVITQVKPDSRFPNGFLLEIPFPNKLEVVNEILFGFLDHHKKPNHSIFVLDVSGSMEGERISELKRALLNLTGEDKSLTGRFAKFRNREQVTFITFNNKASKSEDVGITQDGKGIANLRGQVDSLNAHGNTAIYDAMSMAYDHALASKKADPNKLYSVVLMSDGENTSGSNFDDFRKYISNQQLNIEGIRTFPVLFGNSNDTEMHELAELTGGRVFDSRKHSLAHVFKKIRGYQ